MSKDCILGLKCLRCYISKNGETHNTKISMEFGNDVDPASGSWEGPKKPSSTFLSGPVPKLQPIDWFRSPKWPFLGGFGESWKMLLFCNGLTYMAQTFRDDSLGQNPTFLLSKCFYFMTPGGAAAFVYFLTKQPVWRCLKDLISIFLVFLNPWVKIHYILWYLMGISKGTHFISKNVNVTIANWLSGPLWLSGGQAIELSVMWPKHFLS